MKSGLIGACAATLLLSGCGSRIPQAVFSPNGNSLVFNWADRGLHRVDIDGSGFRPIRESKDAVDPSWSPDGRWLFFTDTVKDPGERIQSVLYDLESEKELDTLEEITTPVAWEKDGSEIAGLSMDEKQCWHLQVRTVPDGRLKRDTRISAKSFTPGESLQSLDGFNSMALMGLTADGWNLFAVEKGVGGALTRTGDVTAFAADPLNRRLRYIRRKDVWGYPALWEYDLRTCSSRKLPFRRALGGNTPTGQRKPQIGLMRFSPRGDRLAFDAGTQTWNGVFTCRLDGTGLRRIEVSRIGELRKSGSGEGEGMHVYWSQDGERLAVFHSLGKPTMRVYDPDGSNGRKVPLPPLPETNREPERTVN